jgi:hypothetical protein
MSLIYLVHALESDFYKIGFATDVKKRLAALRTACPFALKLLATRDGTIGIEQSIHAHLRKHHVRGEWFQFASPPQAMYFFAEWQPAPMRRSTPKVVALDGFVLGDVESPNGNVRA